LPLIGGAEIKTDLVEFGSGFDKCLEDRYCRGIVLALQMNQPDFTTGLQISGILQQDLTEFSQGRREIVQRQVVIL